MLSFGATKVASVAKDNAFKYGNLASQKVVEVSHNVQEKVDFCAFEFYNLFLWFLWFCSG